MPESSWGRTIVQSSTHGAARAASGPCPAARGPLFAPYRGGEGEAGGTSVSGHLLSGQGFVVGADGIRQREAVDLLCQLLEM